MKYSFLLLIILSFASCSFNSKKSRDRYFADHGEWDMVRFPLIKPYEALRLNGDTTWLVQPTQDSESIFAASGARKVNIINKKILLVYCHDTFLNGRKAKDAWFIMIPSKNIEKGFSSEIAFQDYLRLMNIDRIPPLYDMNTVFSVFDKRDTIKWDNISK